MPSKRNSYSNEFKLRVVLESLQRDMTIEKVRQKFSIATSQIHKWKAHFKRHAASVFSKVMNQSVQQQDPRQSVASLKAIIGELTVENQILKKALEHLD